MIDRRAFTPDGSNPPFAVPIDNERTVPTEDMASRLANLLNTDGDVLEIGTGSGYQTAILAERCRSVTSIELDWLEGVEAKLPDNVILIITNGFAYDTDAQYDGILVTCSSPKVMDVWKRQLREGGRLVVPLKGGSPAAAICVFEKIGGVCVLIDIPAYAPFTEGKYEG